MASISDVAQRAGVSTATVSNTINRPEVVKALTREKVLRAIRDLGFIPNQNARQLSGVSSQVLGLVLIDGSNSFFAEVARAVDEAATATDHVVIQSSSSGSPEKERRLLRMLAGQRVRGVLLSPVSVDSLSEPLSFPVVLLDYAGSSEMCSVAVDDVRGGRLAAEHLIGLGHRRIAFVGDAPHFRQHADRLKGARDAIAGAGLDPVEVVTQIGVSRIDSIGGAEVTGELLSGEEVTAVFCANDALAFGVYRGLAQRGIHVPSAMSLMGYDDVDVAVDWIVPLTSVRQPAAEIGRRATELLLEHTATDRPHTHQQMILQPELVARHSTAAPNPKGAPLR